MEFSCTILCSETKSDLVWKYSEWALGQDQEAAVKVCFITIFLMLYAVTFLFKLSFEVL